MTEDYLTKYLLKNRDCMLVLKKLGNYIAPKIIINNEITDFYAYPNVLQAFNGIEINIAEVKSDFSEIKTECDKLTDILKNNQNAKLILKTNVENKFEIKLSADITIENSVNKIEFRAMGNSLFEGIKRISKVKMLTNNNENIYDNNSKKISFNTDNLNI